MAKVFTITEGLENMGALKTGGQGSVYKGKRIGEIITAIKMLPTPIYSESADDKNFISFRNEVEKLKKVNQNPNPNVVKIISSGITDSGNFPYIEMEYIEGPDLEDLLKPPHNPIFTIKEVLKIADQLSHALAHCHKVDVRHGDIKSNNVKYNTRTGNYVLLDFGLSVMSDEERRTSLRHAGAIEFMAPEQNEGQMLFQTDVYSFGVILFELLAGTVPFPLKDKGETARNNVMVAHMETPPPNLLILRKQALPPTWDIPKRDHEMDVPDWLIGMIYKCLEKKPANRFANGMELHEYIWRNSIIRTASKTAGIDDQVQALLKENKRLFAEKEQLQKQLLQYQGKAGAPVSTNTNYNVVEPAYTSGTFTEAAPSSSSWGKGLLLGFIVLAALGSLVYYLVKGTSTQPQPVSKPTVTQTAPQKTIVGEYRVLAARAYFYNEPDEATKRKGYAIPSEEIIKATDDQNDFIYTQIVNANGQVSKGWLRKQDLLTLAEWKLRNKTTTSTTTNDVKAQLISARTMLANGQVPEALALYDNLVTQQVPEAMYEYANLALQNNNNNIDCARAFQLLTNSANAGYAPGKTTLGFLYCFADNEEVLKASNYFTRCTFNKNISKGSQLLIQAMLQGDTTASRLLDELNIKR